MILIRVGFVIDRRRALITSWNAPLRTMFVALSVIAYGLSAAGFI